MKDLRNSYEKAKANLLSDSSICEKNRDLFRRFLEFEEYKLKRVNGIASLDDGALKTVLAYTSRLRVVNRWFDNKPWEELTQEDIQKVYDALEEGRIVSKYGKPIKDRESYYQKVLRGKPFKMAGKREIVDAVMEIRPRQKPEPVRFIWEADFRKLLEATSKTEQRTFLWLCWDIGENATSILKLRKCDFIRRINDYTKEPEYVINLRPEILKRTRKSRSELTNYQETVTHLDYWLKQLNDEELLFDFGVGWAKKFLIRAVDKTGIRCVPGGQRVTLKDLRSSMACNLLSKGWSGEEVNARLGHTPSSRELDRYINFLAIDRHRPKQKFQDNLVRQLERDLESVKEREKKLSRELQRLEMASREKLLALGALLRANLKTSRLLAHRGAVSGDDVVFCDQLEQQLTEMRRAEANFEDSLQNN